MPDDVGYREDDDRPEFSDDPVAQVAAEQREQVGHGLEAMVERAGVAFLEHEHVDEIAHHDAGDPVVRGPLAQLTAEDEPESDRVLAHGGDHVRECVLERLRQSAEGDRQLDRDLDAKPDELRDDGHEDQDDLDAEHDAREDRCEWGEPPVISDLLPGGLRPLVEALAQAGVSELWPALVHSAVGAFEVVGQDVQATADVGGEQPDGLAEQAEEPDGLLERRALLQPVPAGREAGGDEQPGEEDGDADVERGAGAE